MSSQSVSLIGVGIDTARYGHHVSFLDQDKRIAAKAFHFTENAHGYKRLFLTLEKLQQKFPDGHFLIRVDAAGQYAENLIQWLHRLEMPCTLSIGQPAKNQAYRKAHFDKRKADPVESLACARFAVVERPPATPHHPPEFSQLRDAVAMMEASAKQHTRLVNQLHALLARTFPELATITSDLSAKWVLKLLDKYPTPARIAAARVDSLTKIPHLCGDRATQLQQAARESTASAHGSVAEQLVRQKVRAIREEQRVAADLEKLVRQAFDALPDGPHRRILTIKGIGLQTAAALLAKIVSIDRFQSASALIGYFGIFPEEVDVSGTDKSGKPKKASQLSMSRKGNDLVRRLLYTAAQCAAKYNPAVKALFARQMAAGKAYNVAIGHCMAKLLRQVFGVWKTNRDFDPDYQRTAVELVQNDQANCSEEQKTAVGHKKAVKPQQQVVTTTTSIVATTSSASKQRPLSLETRSLSHGQRSSRGHRHLPADETERLQTAGENQSCPIVDPAAGT